MTLRATIHAGTGMGAAAMRVISYARFSTDMQQASSIDAQHHKNREVARAMGWNLVSEMSDHAISGQTSDRDGYRVLLEDIECGNVDVVIAESLDRLSRNRRDTADLWDLTQFNRVQIYTLDRRSFVTSLDIGVAGLVHPLEIEKTAQRTHRSQEHKVVVEGKSAGGLSYGYRVPIGEDGLRITGELEIVEKEGAIVLRILREYAEGRSPHDIACDLNRDGIPAPHSGKRNSGSHWTQNTINGNRERGTGLLNNELYVGRRVWNRLEWKKHPKSGKRVPRLGDPSEHKIAEVPHLRIVPDELWLAVRARQGAMGARRPERSRADRNGLSASQALRRPRYLRSSFLVCGCCGGKMTIVGSGKKYNYCATQKTKGTSVCKGMPGLVVGVRGEGRTDLPRGRLGRRCRNVFHR